MTRPYDSIPRAGGPHEKEIDEEHSGMNVRAPRSGDDQRADKPAASKVLNILVNESTGCFRFHSGKGDSKGQGFADLCAVDLEGGIAPALEQVGEGPFWVVFENEETGEVLYEADHNLSDNWSDGGRFDMVTLFPSEESASEYVEERQKKADG